MASASSPSVHEWLSLGFGIASRLELRLIPPLLEPGPYSSSVPTSEAKAAFDYLGLSARGIEPRDLSALFPAFTSRHIAAKGPNGEVFLIDTWSRLDAIARPQAQPGGYSSPGLGVDLAEAYLGWERGRSHRLGPEIPESLASLYALVVHAGLDARLLGLLGSSNVQGPGCPGTPILQDLGWGTDLAARLCMLCPQGDISAFPGLPLASALSWRRALG